VIGRAAGILAALCGALLLAGCASGPKGPRGDFGGLLRPIAQPGQVVATEFAFARAAQEDGQWAAYADFAAENAVMFVPQPVHAKAWLKGRANPPQAMIWRPHRIWSSCDGSLAVAQGATQLADGSAGYFTAVWQRQEDGAYRWTMRGGGSLDLPLVEPEMVQTEVATCNPRPAASAGDSAVGGEGGASRDRTLSWTAEVAPDGSRIFSLMMWNGTERNEVLHHEVAPEG
jgi:hypothetical protein